MSIDKQEKSSNQHGFTLIELAIVLCIVGILLAGFLNGVGQFRTQLKWRETERYLKQAQSALLTYIALNGRLPCPDSNGDGYSEDEFITTGASACKQSYADLPYLTLGLTKLSPWHDRAFYVVNQKAETKRCATEQAVCFFEAHQVSFATSAAAGSLDIYDDQNEEVAVDVLAVIGSFGKNHAQVRAQCSLGNSAAERENCTNNRRFVSRRWQAVSEQKGFDDQLIWIDTLMFKGQLIVTQQLIGNGN